MLSVRLPDSIEKRLNFLASKTNRTKSFLTNELAEFKEKMVLTGATGFDRYKLYKFETKQSFLERYKLSHFKKVIGYAGWAFGKLHNSTGLDEIKITFKEKAKHRIEWMTQQQLKIENILRESIENNPDTLFILKRHPNEIHPHLVQKDNNEMINLEHYPNVLYLRNEEDIHTLISVSDIWTAFESTTTIEAWMMKDIPTIFINPDINFLRDENYKGTVIVESYKQFQSAINEYYNTNKVNDMYLPEKIEARKKIIYNVIGFADGLNHLRASYYLKKTITDLPENKQKIKFNILYYIRYILVSFGALFYNKTVFER